MKRFPCTYCYTFFTRDGNTIILQAQFWLLLPDIELTLAEKVCEQLCLDMQYDFGHIINCADYSFYPIEHEHSLGAIPDQLSDHFQISVSRDFGNPLLYGKQTPIEGRDPNRNRRPSIFELFEAQSISPTDNESDESDD